ncbi:MAG: hypothetical protein H6831_07525 [Planctomycetes bacterium]|nr:hypothetical protein [Planctomycetota bacterium]MCB9904240.1 hypothetical protein [Planctomycetota bacterium]
MRRLLPLLILLTACQGAGERAHLSEVGGPSAPQAQPERHAAPAGWNSCSPYGFEALAAKVPSGDEAFLWKQSALDAFKQALEREDQTSVRAAVLCARSRDPLAGEVLLARLEARRLGPARNSDAGDVVAAAGLAGWHFRADLADRLAALSSGAGPHPDLEVRVECAASALRLGAPTESVAPFLLTVLCALTPGELERPSDWPRQANVAWVKTRAAEVLSERAGLPCRFRPDASFDDQAAEIAKLERALASTD